MEERGPAPNSSSVRRKENTVGVVYTSGFLHDSVAAEFITGGFFGRRKEEQKTGEACYANKRPRGWPLGVDTFALGDDHVIK